MERQRYTAGQIVSVTPTSLSGPSTADKFRVVRRYPIPNLPDLYWLRSLADPSQRMVAAGELSSATPSQSMRLRAFDARRLLSSGMSLRDLSAAA